MKSLYFAFVAFDINILKRTL